MKVKDLTVEQLKQLIEETIEEKIEELLGDPDEGLEIREEVIERLKHSMAAVKKGERGIPLGQVAKKLGIEW